MTKFEVRDIKGNVILATTKKDLIDYCYRVFKITKQVASWPNYIEVSGYRHEDMKEIIEANLKSMMREV